jgi:hypothetical protein
LFIWKKQQDSHMQARRFKDDDYLAIKSAVRRCCRLAGTREQIAAQTRVGSTQIANYGDALQADCHVPIDVAMDMDELAGEDIILAQWAASKGYHLTQIAPSAASSDLMHHAASICKETGEALASISRAEMTPRECDEAVKEVLDVLSAGQACLRELHARKARAVA